MAGRSNNGDLILREPINIERHSAATVSARRNQPAVARKRSKSLGEQVRRTDVFKHRTVFLHVQHIFTTGLPLGFVCQTGDVHHNFRHDFRVELDFQLICISSIEVS